MTVYPVLHPGMNRMFAGHQSAPGRCTDRADIVSVQQQARVCQCVDVRRRNLTQSVKPDVVPSLYHSNTFVNQFVNNCYAYREKKKKRKSIVLHKLF